MLKTVRKAFQIEDIRKRLFYTFLMLIVVRFGSQLPTPGVDPTYIQNLLASQNRVHTAFLMHSPVVRSQGCQSSH